MLNYTFKMHHLCLSLMLILLPSAFFPSSNKLLFFCLFSFVSMTTDDSHCCCIVYSACMMYVKGFSHYFFSGTDSQKLKSLPCDTLMILSALSSSSHVASGLKKCIFECLPTRIFLCLCSNYHPYHTHAHNRLLHHYPSA